MYSKSEVKRSENSYSKQGNACIMHVLWIKARIFFFLKLIKYSAECVIPPGKSFKQFGVGWHAKVFLI